MNSSAISKRLVLSLSNFQHYTVDWRSRCQNAVTLSGVVRNDPAFSSLPARKMGIPLERNLRERTTRLVNDSNYSSQGNMVERVGFEFSVLLNLKELPRARIVLVSR